MKNLILIISLILGFTTKAQQSELIENTWYLEKLVIDDDEFFPPNNEEVNYVVLNYVEGNFEFVSTVCANLLINLDLLDNYSFWATSIRYDNETCTENENLNFEFNYFDIFWGSGIFEGYGYTYEIVSGDNAMQLIITNSLGSKAYYNNAPLSISEVNLVANHFQIAFYHEDLVVKSSQSVAESVLIFDLNGRLVQKSKVENEKIRTANLPKGIYVVKIIDKNGKTYTQKIRK